MAGKSSETITAEAEVVLAAAAYFGLATKLICPATASSIPATPVISASGSPFCSVAPSTDAISDSFIFDLFDRELHIRRKRSGEHRHLARVLGTRTAGPRLLVANHCEHRQLSQRRTRHKDALRVGTSVRRNNGEAFDPLVQQGVWHHAFDGFVVPEAQTHPQPL